ncbi:hypothetical protein E2C01_009538 [Portunus trituberculatus]|uniref:Uncharacterized protein n=1 Tax=Portunus trituberculatus TaxID=210409 RepID=A0A5B7D625_PORTR|nr:hypothetical protein [Portunus trituberculatus]
MSLMSVLTSGTSDGNECGNDCSERLKVSAVSALSSNLAQCEGDSPSESVGAKFLSSGNDGTSSVAQGLHELRSRCFVKQYWCLLVCIFGRRVLVPSQRLTVREQPLSGKFDSDDTETQPH